MKREDYRRVVYEVARAIAPGWERQRGRIETAVAPVREWLISQLAPRAGDTVLELAAGAGDTGFEAAALVGENGRLISTDFSPEMVEVARRRGAELGLSNVDYRVMDAERVELEANSVDGVLCRFGYMLMANPDVALSETRRVLRSGGRLGFSVWGAPDRNPWMTILAGMLIEDGHVPPPEPGTPDPFSMASEDHTRALLKGAGFKAIRMEEVPVSFAFRDVDDYVSYATDTAGPFAIVLRGLSEGEANALKAKLEGPFARFAVERGYVLPGVSLGVVAS